MANEEHLAILRQGVEVWNAWRENNPDINPDLSCLNFNKIDLDGFNFSNTVIFGSTFGSSSLRKTLFTRAFLQNTDLAGVDLTGSNLRGAFLNKANLLGANLCQVDLSYADLSETDLSSSCLIKAKLLQTNLVRAYLAGANLVDADLSHANLMLTTAAYTNFERAILTGACIEAWNTNERTNFNFVTCDYIYLRHEQQERRPSSGNFAPGEFTKLFQKSLETVDLIFRNGIDWDAFAYSFKKVEVENQGAQLDVQSIEKKGDGILVVRVAVAPDADKAKIHNDFMQGYEFAAKTLEAQYQARLEDKDKVINQLFSTIDQQNQLLAQTGDKVSIYYQPNSQFAGGIVDANTVDAQQIGGNIQNNNTEDFSS
ncbi:pentapeptide repeat-containing protein (plasmid) [Anabaena sp. FACHB-709]|uniref:Pentapeptide repeat-containing protein n=2 Tax=Nostocaceae TaxID=1162 RepID=A0A1Z4KUI0_ANAVA|nr:MULTISPECIES: pentapeptide repeat-containing protein [Nostocaceae]BAY72691.1 hypothetical protein NIES23_55190 [Trichormus variabilis NIES-23]MBD2174390.1 pentapeptide repeat-containing protein [Anabaena cylindrica FACHB-318]MBD2266126.1 pentapeptide repeat-containing protein [Anabaena sp. FACHB-709]MBD2275572.1 pentapeptide repeat-containing protein [Nostoc sp. PCC 7120 = FACHB-418]MBD2286476.1 pentapeptide repeat-containing protein [Anabaena cylindrica FACHB-170]